jgi:ABC-type sugar transport system substrate-binding protein
MNSLAKQSRTATLAVVLSACLVVAACSSSGKSGTPSSSGASTGTATASSSVAGAQAVVNQYSAQPASIGVTTPLAGSVPKGKTVVFLSCSLDTCRIIADGAKAAAAAAGLTIKILTFDSSNPASLINVMNQALQYNPIAVAVPGLPEQAWNSEVPKYRAAGVPIIPVQIGSALTNDTIKQQVGADGTITGKVLANWFIADSNGHGNAVFINIPGFPTTIELLQSFQSTLASGCSDCKISVTDLTIAQQESGAIASVTVSALKRDPQAKYLLTYGAAFAGVPALLKAAGITGIKVGVGFNVTSNFDDVQQGNIDANVAGGGPFNGWLFVDAALRAYNHQAVGADYGVNPVQIVTKANLDTVHNQIIAPTDYQQQFLKLWGLN